MNAGIHLERIKKNAPILELLDKAIEEEFGISIQNLKERDRTRITTTYRVLYSGFAREIIPRITCIELGYLINRTHGAILWQLKQYNNWLDVDKSFQETRNRLQTKFQQLKQERENGMA